MTIETATNKIVVLGNGSTSVFNYGFLVKQVSHIELIYTDLLGTQTLIPSSSFSITGLNNPLGGTFTYPLSGLPIASGTSLSFRRIVPYVQGTDLENQGAFAPEVVEDALDYGAATTSRTIITHHPVIRIRYGRRYCTAKSGAG
jgi:hypothetical protein